MNTKLYLLLVFLVCQTIFTADPPAKKGLTPEEYQKMSYVDKSKLCTGKYNKSVCNTVEHCCYWEYKDPRYDEYQPVCYNFDVFHKFYVRDDEAYILKIAQSSYRTAVKENNLCDLLANDDRFPKLRNCSCRFISDLSSGLLKTSIFFISTIIAAVSLL